MCYMMCCMMTHAYDVLHDDTHMMCCMMTRIWCATWWHTHMMYMMYMMCYMMTHAYNVLHDVLHDDTRIWYDTWWHTHTHMMTRIRRTTLTASATRRPTWSSLWFQGVQSSGGRHLKKRCGLLVCVAIGKNENKVICVCVNAEGKEGKKEGNKSEFCLCEYQRGGSGCCLLLVWLFITFSKN